MKIKKIKSLVCLAICTAILTAAVNINAAWDGYKEAAEGGQETKLLVDTENLSNIFASGALPSTENVKTGKYSAHWYNHPQTTVLNFTNVERDWSDCESVTFDIYSEKATNANIVFMVYCDYVPTPGKTISYQRYDFKIDWTGWKTFQIPYADFTTGNYADWAKVIRLEFISSGWGCTPNAESDLYITSVYGNIGEGEEGGNAASSMNITSKDEQDVYSALGSSTAVMNFGGNIISGGETQKLEQNEKITTADA